MNIKKNSFESQLYNKAQVRYNYLNRYDKEKEYRVKKVYAIRPFLNNSTYGNAGNNLNIYSESYLYPFNNTSSAN
jgi:competence CoiA-like predicted nuclease